MKMTEDTHEVVAYPCSGKGVRNAEPITSIAILDLRFFDWY